MSSHGGEDAEDILSKTKQATDELYRIRDTYFSQNPEDKIAMLKYESDLALRLLDSIPLQKRRLSTQRALFEYLRGKILDVLPDYNKEAEDHLSKAGPNKNILCEFSMLERKIAQGSENQVAIIEESIQHAKEAIALDVKDGNSWYNLGNAYLTRHIRTQ